MTTPNTAADLDVSTPEDALTPQSPDSTVEIDRPADLFTPGVHEAVFTILNGEGIKEQVEEIVLTRRNHLRPGEEITLIEHATDDVVHQQFHTIVSVQAVIADLRRRGIDADLKIHWSN